jgi:hypothetical protein
VRGTPRSLILTWANTAAGWWTSAAAIAIQRQQRAMLNVMTLKVATKQRTKTKRR